MPKMKTHSGAKKRFKTTKKGKVIGRHAMTSHILGKKSPKRKRRLAEPLELEKSQAKVVKKLLLK
jgi:large subunit ribosomal protein L35